MTLELSRVGEQIDQMGRELAERGRRHQEALPAARNLLRHFSEEVEFLSVVARSDPGRRLRCATPLGERLDRPVPLPPLPEQFTIVAADGSQLFPDRHGLAFYYVINVGGIIFRHGSGQAPRVVTAPQLVYTEDQVYPGGVPVTSDLVSALRNLGELQMLGELALGQLADRPACVAVADGPLLIWLQEPAVPENQQARILTEYVSCLERMRDSGAAVAGFVSRPQSAEVVALLYLAQLGESRRQEVRSLAETSYRGLADRALFGYLRPGDRSALFVRGTAANEPFRAAGQAVHFFYLNTGTDMARVEVPEWVAAQPDQLGLVHAAIYDQCSFNSGYPYVLTRADEQAVILAEEREALESMIARAMARHGLPLPELSRKAQQKQIARWRRRR